MKPSTGYSGNGWGWDKQLPHHIVNTSSSAYFYNTCAVSIPNYCDLSFICPPAAPVGTVCASPTTLQCTNLGYINNANSGCSINHDISLVLYTYLLNTHIVIRSTTWGGK